VDGFLCVERFPPHDDEVALVGGCSLRLRFATPPTLDAELTRARATAGARTACAADGVAGGWIDRLASGRRIDRHGAPHHGR
jgi:hypothetical protein